MVELLCVPPPQKAMIWPLVADRLRASYLKTDLGHTADLERDVLHGDADLWLAVSDGKEIEAAAVTLLVRTDRHLVCQLTALGGKNMAHWFGLLPKIEDWARREGAAKVRIMGRIGWVCMLEDYRVSAIVLERAL